MMALATRYAVSTQVASSCVAPRPPAMGGRATLAMEESSTSIKVARVTVMATIQGLMLGRQGRSTAGATGAGTSSIWRVAVAMSLFGFYGDGAGFRELSLNGDGNHFR